MLRIHATEMIQRMREDKKARIKGSLHDFQKMLIYSSLYLQIEYFINLIGIELYNPEHLRN